MRNLKLLGLVFPTVLLAACGSGGGGSGGEASSANSPSVTSQIGGQSSVNSIGGAYRTSTHQYAELTSPNGNFSQQLVIDGKVLPLRLSGVSSGSGFTVAKNGVAVSNDDARVNGVSSPDFAVSGNRYSEIRFGYAGGYAFYQGNVTPVSEMPTQGVVTYTIDGVYVKDDKAYIGTGATLEADFANKTLTGTLFQSASATDVVITEGKISGNTFSGRVVQGMEAGDMQGKFYGYQGSEIAGAYQADNHQWLGAFGGAEITP